ncbi:MAG: 16S rRNA (guanine(527)-N(7))-methyltransferase RsmG [Coriobacteriales bacterium]|nr:16S rRNA (guanine(527)-N(7))-methyltransferase RsmG [Coriobacteriales bacterium]
MFFKQEMQYKTNEIKQVLLNVIKDPIKKCAFIYVDESSIKYSESFTKYEHYIKQTKTFLELQKCLFKLSLDQIETLSEYLCLVLNKNQELKLTAIKNITDAVKLHIIDSMIASPFISKKGQVLNSNINLCDLGCGAGFPGIVLKVVCGCQTLLIDSVQKKINCVNEFINQTNIQNANALALRSETLAKQQRESFDFISSRAVASLIEILELSSPLVKIGGQIILYRGQTEAKDALLFKEIYDVFGLKLHYIFQYSLDDFETGRCLLVFDKIKACDPIFPRREGMVKKKPLVKKYGLEDILKRCCNLKIYSTF